MGDQIMKTRRINPEVRPVSNVQRKHPVSIAVSIALPAAAAAEGPAQSGTGSAATDEGPKKSQTETVTVTGVRVSQERAIEVKRLAPSIQDSISAESIGQLPDTTITDALQ